MKILNLYASMKNHLSGCGGKYFLLKEKSITKKNFLIHHLKNFNKSSIFFYKTLIN